MNKLKILHIGWMPKEGKEKIYEPLQKYARPDVEVYHIDLDPNKAPFTHTWRYYYYMKLCTFAILDRVHYAEVNGYDAVLLDCFGDPALREAREIVRIPVIGPGESSMHIACMLGHSFSILVNCRNSYTDAINDAKTYGVFDKVKSVRWVDLASIEMLKNQEKARKRILEEAKKAVEEDGAEVVVSGCTTHHLIFEEVGGPQFVQDEIGVPYVDPSIVSLKMAEIMAELYRNIGLSHSKVGRYFFEDAQNFLKRNFIFKFMEPV